MRLLTTITLILLFAMTTYANSFTLTFTPTAPTLVTVPSDIFVPITAPITAAPAGSFEYDLQTQVFAAFTIQWDDIIYDAWWLFGFADFMDADNPYLVAVGCNTYIDSFMGRCAPGVGWHYTFSHDGHTGRDYLDMCLGDDALTHYIYAGGDYAGVLDGVDRYSTGVFVVADESTLPMTPALLAPATEVPERASAVLVLIGLVSVLIMRVTRL